MTWAVEVLAAAGLFLGASELIIHACARRAARLRAAQRPIGNRFYDSSTRVSR